MDAVVGRADHDARHADEPARAALAATMCERLRARLGVRPVVELVPPGALERSEFKARRVIDDRDLYRSLRAETP
jgi:phenylacetate-CoA ligase